MAIDIRISQNPSHLKRIDSLINEFGEGKKPHIIARYLHQYYLSEEDPNLNGNLPNMIYLRTRETLRAEYRDLSKP
jgi:hypothetical protein